MCTAVSAEQIEEILVNNESIDYSKMEVFKCNEARVKELQRMLTTKVAPEFHKPINNKDMIKST